MYVTDRQRRWAAAATIAGLSWALLWLLLNPPPDRPMPRMRDDAPPPQLVNPKIEPEDVGAVPYPDTSGGKPRRILRELLAFRDWLTKTPDPNLVDEYIDPECPCYKHERRYFRWMTSNGYVREGLDVHILKFESVRRVPGGEGYLLLVEQRASPGRFVDEKGRVIDRSTRSDHAVIRIDYGLHQGDDGRWRISQVIDLGEAVK